MWTKNNLRAFPQGGLDSTPTIENPLGVVFVQFFSIPAKLMYNCRSHAKLHSQKFKIDRVEELWNSRRKLGKKICSQKKSFITPSNLHILNSNFYYVYFFRPIFENSQYFRKALKVVSPNKISFFRVYFITKLGGIQEVH